MIMYTSHLNLFNTKVFQNLSSHGDRINISLLLESMCDTATKLNTNYMTISLLSSLEFRQKNYIS